MSALDSDQRSRIASIQGETLRIPLSLIRDRRGVLLFGQAGDQLPFAPVRFFTISEVPPAERRAEHAHHTLEEVFVPLRGACTVTLDDGVAREDFRLDRSDVGLYKPRMLWVVLHSFTPDALLLVLASDIWKDEDHIKDFETFRRLAEESRRERI